jgi:hypothetical protein
MWGKIAYFAVFFYFGGGQNLLLEIALGVKLSNGENLPGGRICSTRRNSVLRTQSKNTLNNCPVLGFNADKTYPIVELAL